MLGTDVQDAHTGGSGWLSGDFRCSSPSATFQGLEMGFWGALGVFRKDLVPREAGGRPLRQSPSSPGPLCHVQCSDPLVSNPGAVSAQLDPWCLGWVCPKP